MELGLRGANVVVMGGSRGIGRAIAQALASEGCNIAICARNAEGVAQTLEALEASGVRAIGEALDIADGPALKSWISRVGEHFGGIDILVSNASAMSDGNSEQAWKAAFEIDLLGLVRAFDAAAPWLIRAAAVRGDASVVVVSSAAAGETRYANSYGAMKAAQVHLVKGLARDFAAKRVRINAISPGPVYFEGGIWHSIEQNNPNMYAEYRAAIPTGRMGAPEEIARAAVFLASPASSFTTGSNMLVDGAFSTRISL